MKNRNDKDRERDVELIMNYNGDADADFHESLVKHIGDGRICIVREEDIRTGTEGKGSIKRILFTNVPKKE